MSKYLGFEEYLEDVCFEENPEVLDDDRPDFFDNWIGGGSMDDLIRHGDNYVTKALAEQKEKIRLLAEERGMNEWEIKKFREGLKSIN